MSSTEEQVWQKGGIIQNADLNHWRIDECGALINRGQYGTRSEFGWQIDHKIPLAKGGTDDLSNLRPLQWLNNESRKEGPLTCPVKWESVEGKSHNVTTCRTCGYRWYPPASTCPKCGNPVK